MKPSGASVPVRNKKREESSKSGDSPPKAASVDLFVDHESERLWNQSARPATASSKSIRDSSATSPISNQSGRPPLSPSSMSISLTWSEGNDDAPVNPQPRKKSMDDYSFVSGLTEPSPSRRPERASLDDSGTHILLPSLQSESRQVHNAALGTVLSVADLHAASPLESEAETSLLRVLDTRGGKNGDQGVGSRILSHVPDEALDALGVEETLTDDSSKTPKMRSLSAAVGRRRSALRTDSVASSGRQKEHRRVASDFLVRGNSASLETKLLGLTNAMHIMHDESVDAADNANEIPKHNRVLSKDQTDPSNIHAPVDHGAGEFVKDANVLFRPLISKEKSDRRGLLNMERRSSLRFSARWNAGASAESNADEMNDDHLVDIDEDDSGENSDPELGDTGLNEESGENGQPTSLQPKGEGWRIFHSARKLFSRTEDEAKEDIAALSDFLEPRRRSIATQIKMTLLFVFIPATALSLFLFYVFGNPDLGRSDGATISWLILFLLRQLISLGLAMATNVFVIDFLSLQCRWTVRAIGPIPTLVLVQSKGFPFVVSAWSFYSLVLLSGRNRFVKHWLFWQPYIHIFNESNPAGTITESRMNFTILFSGLIFGFVVTAKRALLGLHFGKKTYLHYGDQLAKLIHSMLLVSEVASLAQDIAKGSSPKSFRDRDHEAVQSFINGTIHEIGDNTASTSGNVSSATLISDQKSLDEEERRGLLSMSQKSKLLQLLEKWEEPDTASETPNDASINAVLKFRQALMLTAGDYPFSLSFGPANTREVCIESAQKVYERLLLHQNKSEAEVLKFDTIALLATTENGDLDLETVKKLIRLFRPDRKGNLSLIDFVKSVDSVYKRLRLLRASIENAGQIDKAAERIFNVIFYLVVGCIFLAGLGFYPIALLVSLSSFLVAFAFMIGSASAKYFEGLLFILVRRPYDIGDRVHVSSVEIDSDTNGSPSWFVENVDLFKTTIRFASTNEVATVSNGSLANSRIINAARSPKMIAYVYMKFSVDVPYHKVQLFRKTVEDFAKQRPREWTSLMGFRATRVEADQGFIEYAIVLEHRERWQNVGIMLNAKAEFSSFCLEVSKKLDMRYRAPPLPVDLNMRCRNATLSTETNDADAHLDSGGTVLSQVASDAAAADTHDMRAIAALFANAKT